MNKNSIKPGATAKSLRKLFIIFLLFTFIVTVGSFILKYAISQKLDRLGVQLKQPSQEPELSNILLDLNSAENDFQQASLHGQSARLVAYKSDLQNVFDRLQTVLKKYEADKGQDLQGSKQQIARSFEQKLAISQQVFDLKLHFDSLLKVTTIASISSSLAEGLPPSTPVKGKPGTKRADTTIKTRQVANKDGLLKRLKDAIANKNQVKIITIREKQIRDSATWLLINGHRRSLGKLLNQLSHENNRVLQSNEQLIGANLNLLAELHGLLQQLKDINLAAWEKSRIDILQQYQSTTSDMNKFIGVAITLVLVFIILLIIYIRKAGEAEQNYLMENERAVTLAGQKSELLATMSHEIRNPLTAITGGIYMLNKTALSPDQEKKVAAINLSSAMLMETINNILDVSKLEHQQADVLTKVIFKPFKELAEVMESMRFMAERKEILLIAEFTGDAETTVNGDAFRLKQIMINLLSNAIKYTDKGSVTVLAGIKLDDQQKAALEVSIKDTGVGIPKEQQAGLFTRYYQANGSHGKPGTGLGLYLCQQLVSLQSGSIQIESEAGKGSTIRFNIPYLQVP